MLGFGPVPEGPRVAAPHVYAAPVPGAVLAVLGILALALVALMPATFDVGSLPLALIGLPLALGGGCGVLMGYAVLSTRIEIARGGLAIAAPGWRACPWPPVREFRLDWADVRAVRHRTELYRIGFLPLRLPLEAHAIETADGFILFGGYYLSDLEPVLIEIAHRADRPWCEDGEVEAGLLRTLLHGAPPWPRIERRPGA
jgi:hypothetical protein